MVQTRSNDSNKNEINGASVDGKGSEMARNNDNINVAIAMMERNHA